MYLDSVGLQQLVGLGALFGAGLTLVAVGLFQELQNRQSRPTARGWHYGLAWSEEDETPPEKAAEAESTD